MTKVVCLICGKEFEILGNHLKHAHGISSIQYKERFPGAKTIGDNLYQKRVEQFQSDKNLMKDPIIAKMRGDAQRGSNNPQFGKDPWNKGKPMSGETKQKDREAHLGKRASEGTKKKLSDSHLKFYKTEEGIELRKKKSENWKGENALMNDPLIAEKVSNSLCGVPKSKEHKEHLSETRLLLFQTDKGKKLAEEHSNFMKNAIKEGKIKVFPDRPTKPQIRLYEFFKSIYSDALLEEHIPNSHRIADILIPSLKLVVEYDGFYWHNGKEEEDNERDIEIQKLGYKVVHIKEDELEDFLAITFLMDSPSNRNL
jgi:hypothetical protein